MSGAFVGALRHELFFRRDVQVIETIDGGLDEGVIVQGTVEDRTSELGVTFTQGSYTILIATDGTM